MNTQNLHQAINQLVAFITHWGKVLIGLGLIAVCLALVGRLAGYDVPYLRVPSLDTGTAAILAAIAYAKAHA